MSPTTYETVKLNCATRVYPVYRNVGNKKKMNRYNVIINGIRQ